MLMNPWLIALREGAVSGSAASVLSTLVLGLAGRRQTASWTAPTNSTSHWIWGRPALHADAPTCRHTATGYAIHHTAAVFWGVLHARSTLAMPATFRAGPAVAAGLAAAAVVCFVDYRATPQRLTPGFEHRLSTMALVLVYGAFGLGMALGSLAWRHANTAGREKGPWSPLRVGPGMGIAGPSRSAILALATGSTQ
jgi:hypothetical protein